MDDADDWLPGDDSDPTAPALPDGRFPTPPVRSPLGLLASAVSAGAAAWAWSSPSPPVPAWAAAVAAAAWLAFALVGRARERSA
jgi:hypothetical protein